MGMQGPLTAQALGRSPFDDVVQGEVEDESDPQAQQYDQRGRPVNPETKRINRNIIRAHNEVMLVIGVAEPEDGGSSAEVRSQARHVDHEDGIAGTLLTISRRTVDVVGCVGLNCLRTRILTYRRYSHVAFSELYQHALLGRYSVSQDILAGAPAEITGIATRYLSSQLSFRRNLHPTVSKCVAELSSYICTHLEIYAAMQRLGLTSSSLWLPPLSYFIPFSQYSPIPPPPPLQDYTIAGVAQWLGGAVISATPFILWTMIKKIVIDWKVGLWQSIYPRLPNTYNRPKIIPPIQTLPQTPASSTPAPENNHARTPSSDSTSPEGEASSSRRDRSHVSSRPASEGTSQPTDAPPAAVSDDFGSDDEDAAQQGQNATLISFDVEATDATDAPPGLWSAELRPSLVPEERSGSSGTASPLYFDTLLTRAPPLLATDILTEMAVRFLSAPYEATALRLMARSWCASHNLPAAGILGGNLLSGLSWTWAVNYFGSELLYLGTLSDVWALFAGTCQWFHVSEEEWKEMEAAKAVSS